VAVFDVIKVAASKGENVTVVAASNSTDSVVKIVLCHINVRATPSNILKWAMCGLYKKSGLGEMRFDGVIMIRYNQGW